MSGMSPLVGFVNLSLDTLSFGPGNIIYMNVMSADAEDYTLERGILHFQRELRRWMAFG